MRLRYLAAAGDASPPEGDGGAQAALVGPLLRETSVIGLPPLSERDAAEAARLGAAAHYPGPAGDLAIAARGWRGRDASAALLHLLRRAPIETELASGRPLIAPQDFLSLEAQGDAFEIFISPGWVEWLAFESGLPVASSALPEGPGQEGLAAALAEAKNRKGPLTIWAPRDQATELAVIKNELGETRALLRTYEEALPALLSRGLASFGTSRPRGRLLARGLIAAFLLVDLALLFYDLRRDLGAEEKKVAALKEERAALLVKAAEIARLKKQAGETAPAPPVEPYGLLALIARALPSEVLLTNVDLAPPAFRISGRGPNAFAVVAALAALPALRDIALEQAAPEGGGYRFAISGRLADDR